LAYDDRDSTARWNRADTLLTIAWFVLGIIARAPLVARIEGVLDHDQSVVGLMALDISRGERFPIFFDGQRYMGAVEAYLAAGFVRLFGHEPRIIALAPLLCFGAFVAGQYAVWRVWRDRRTGLVAAGLTAVGSPMIALWGIVPRGGYVEFLAWALPTLAVYRHVARSGQDELSIGRQVAWGFLLSLGYFLNPLSLTIYVTILLDWMLARHGADFRKERFEGVRWIDWKGAGFVWVTMFAVWIAALAFCCYVDPHAAATGLPYIAFAGLMDGAWTLPAGALGVVLILGATGWWSNGPRRLYAKVIEQPWVLLGTVIAFLPFVVNGVLTKLGIVPSAPSLPVWIAAPWRAGPNLRTIGLSLSSLLGSNPRVAETVLIGQGVDPPPLRQETLAAGLLAISPFVVAIILSLIVIAAWRDRDYWRRFTALRSDNVAPASAFADSYMAISLGLFLLQGTSPNGSSVRYLVPLWVVLPGVISCGMQVLPRKFATAAFVALVIPWTACQVSLWHDFDREASARPLAAELVKRGIKGIIAPTPVALIVANLSHGEVGALEFRSIWPRLGERHASRFPLAKPLTCVVDRRFPWKIHGEGGWAPEQDLRSHLQSLASRNPGQVSRTGEIGPFEIWNVDLPLDLVLGKEIDHERVANRP